MNLDKHLSPYILSQFPRLYREEGPAFIAFVRAYYEWMEQEGGVLHDSKRLLEYRDIDTTTEDFLQHFKDKYMVGIPESVLGDKRALQKHIKEIYSSKGTTQGLELLFRLLYNESSEVYLPGNDLMRPSDGVWHQPVYLEVSVNPYNVLLIGERITGRESGATAIVEDFQVRYINKRQINVLFLSNVRGDFQTNEILLNDVIGDPLNSPSVVGSMSEILINESGFGFKVGDVLEVGEGSGMLGKAVVSSVSPRNGAVQFTILKGGSGFANNNPWAPNEISVTAVDPDNPGLGADFEVGEIANTEVIVTAVDPIEPYLNTTLNSTNYNFPTFSHAENIATPLNQALNIQNITVGTIVSLRAINPGEGYNGPVVVSIENPVISGLKLEDPTNGNFKGDNAHIDGKAAAGDGAIDSVKILNSGIGYANGDVITLVNPDVPYVAGGAVVLRKQGIGEGFWKDTRSFLNSDKYIQDSYYYQEYSYETRLSIAFENYSDLLKKLWHPAGTEGFGKVVITTEIDSGSEAVEVDIVASRITEYMTSFSTHVLTEGITTTRYYTEFSTEYPTIRDTETSRLTSEDFLISEPNLIINGSFDTSVSNWIANGDAIVEWIDGAMRVTRVTDGSAYQAFATVPGTSYQVDIVYEEATGSVTAYASNENTVVEPSNILAQKAGLEGAGIIRFTFEATNEVTYLVISAKFAAEFDDVKVRKVPTLDRLTSWLTAYQRDTTVNGGTRLTQFNTTTNFLTNYNTQYLTVFDFYPTKETTFMTNVLTQSLVTTNRSTVRNTTTTFNTAFLTSLATQRITATDRITTFAASRSTDTAFNTTYQTAMATNRATTTSFVTTFNTFFATNRATTTTFATGYITNVATNRATTTVFNTSKSTTTSFNTSKSTTTTRGTSKSTTTVFNTSRSTNRATATSRTTTYNTTYATAYVASRTTTWVTTFSESTYWMTYSASQSWNTGGNTTKTKSTSRSTSYNASRNTSRGTSKTTTWNTTTTFNTAIPTNRATTTSYNTAFVTTTTYATHRATTTTFATNRATTTTFDTGYGTSKNTSKSTTTTFDTSLSTSRATNRVTTTVFNTTFNTTRATNRATTTSFTTEGLTTWGTATSFFTNIETARSTNRTTATTYDTVFTTEDFKLTSIGTSGLTNTSIPTNVSTLTFRATNKITTRPTLTSRTTNLLTNIATDVQRTTSRNTVFVAFPTSFVTTFFTGTEVVTEYQTKLETERETATIFDTEYPTERQTSVFTQADVADD